MAVTEAHNSSTDYVGSAATLPGFTALGQYLRAKAEPSLFKNYELNPWGTKAIQPGGTGAVIYAPTFTNDTTSGVKTHSDKMGSTEAAPETARALAFSNYSATLGYYQDSFSISKVFAATATLQDYLDRAADFLTVSAAQTIELNNRAAVVYSSGTTLLDASGDNEVLYAGPDGSTAFDSVTNGTTLVTPKGFALVRKKLRNASNPGFQEANGKFIGLVGPETIFQISSSVVSTTPTFEESSMGKESVFTDNVIGDLYGIRAIESNYILALTAGQHGLSTSTTGELNVFLAPHAFYTASHESLGLNINVIPFNAQDKSDPSGQYMTIAVDYMHAAIQGDVANKVVHMPVPTGGN